MSEEQLREYVQRLRSAPAEQIVGSVLGELLEVARVKLGRRDARLFIDSCAVLLDQTKAYVSSDLAGQTERALNELRLAQVQAERSPQRADEPNDLTETPQPAAPTSATPSPATTPASPGSPASGPAARPATGAPASSRPSPAQPAPEPSSPASKLWLPGRDF